MVKLKNVLWVPRNALLVLFIISALVSLFALRHNNLTMVKLREAVYTADRENGDVNLALNNLRSYVYNHMNTNLNTGTTIKPPIQLKYTYQRLVAAQQSQISQSSLYTDAENYCQATQPNGFYGASRIPCVISYINSHGGKVASSPTIPDGLYKFDFISPVWSPDLAGWSLVATAILFLAYLGNLVMDKILKAQLKKRFD